MVKRRWKLFLALYDLGEQEPTHEMVKLFVGFMYTYRQRTSKTGRQGLGDSMAEMDARTAAWKPVVQSDGDRRPSRSTSDESTKNMCSTRT